MVKVLKNKILLIEDELDIMFIYKTALKAAHIGVDGISSGKEAMEKVRELQQGRGERPALVLLDFVFPDINRF